MNCRRALLALWLVAGAAGAQDKPVIMAIEFEGNEITRSEVMLREMVIKPGDPLDASQVERSRQGVQDLGLFKSVTVREAPAEGGVILTFVVEERWYILPVPRIDANSEGESAAGVSLRWFNVAGHNHTFRANWTRRDDEKVNKGESTSYSLAYAMPFVFDTPYGIGFSVGHKHTPINLTTTSKYGDYVESSDSVNVAANRSFAKGPASQGWSAGLSLGWRRQDTEGPLATTPPAYGQATSLGASAGFRDVHYNIYSENGVFYGAEVAGAMDGVGSDYSFTSLTADWGRYLVVGERAHQNVNFFAKAGSYHGGPPTYKTDPGTYALGGASDLRGYPGDSIAGDFFYQLAAEYVRPIGPDWLRGLIVVEAGNAYEDARNLRSGLYSSIGIGLRLRITFLVSVEVEAGVAWPSDGGGQRFFASKV
jgi:outer membrane protein assembly factor BamA